MVKLIVSALVGAALGLISSRYLFVGSALSLVPWGIVGLLLGYWMGNWKTAAVGGALFGFFLAFIFMLSGYQGDAPVLSRFPFFAILGLFGAVCGILLSVIGSFVSRGVSKSL